MLLSKEIGNKKFEFKFSLLRSCLQAYEHEM